MKIDLIWISILQIIIFCNVLMGQNNSSDIVEYDKTLTSGAKVKISKKVTTRIVTEDDVSNNLPKNIKPILGEYTDQTYSLYISDLEEPIWKIVNSYANTSFSHLFEDRFKFHDIVLNDNKIYMIYTFGRSVYCEILNKTSKIWTTLGKTEIVMEFKDSGLSVKNASIFKTDLGLYAIMTYFTNKQELWLISNLNGAILLWTTDGTRKGREFELRHEYYKIIARDKYEKKLEDEASKANGEKKNANKVPNVKDEPENKNDNDIHKDEVVLKATNNNRYSKNAVSTGTNAVNNENGAGISNDAGSTSNSSEKLRNINNTENKYESDSENAKNPDDVDQTDTAIYVWGFVIVLSIALIVFIIRRR